MAWVYTYLSSSVGKKNLMALTGIALVTFVLIHMAGHLIMFGGQEAYNNYAESMQANPVKWPARAGLLAVFIVHIALGILLASQNRAARPVAYASRDFQQASFASRNMIWTGLVVLFFTLYHLAHFTLFWVQDTGPHLDAMGRPDIYTRMIVAFENPIVIVLYTVSMIVLAFHLVHGIQSMFQSLGLNHPRYNLVIRRGGPALGIVIVVGFLAVPLAILAGVIS